MSSADDRLHLLVALRDRDIFYLTDSHPAVYYLAERELGGVLVNAPPFAPDLLAALNARAPLAYVFLPSARGARDLDAWRRAAGTETLATEAEAAAITGNFDLTIYAGRKLSRTIDFLPMSGVTAGSCALRIRTNGARCFSVQFSSPAPTAGRRSLRTPTTPRLRTA